ncbi:MAG: FAD-binding oxidoreductase [Methylophaga sp.]|nr:MAG: FAD-binding oxidoreductase [Methylophaga sp.]
MRCYCTYRNCATTELKVVTSYTSWAYVPTSTQKAIKPAWMDFDLGATTGSLLPYGNGRSYGDSCLNSSGLVIDSKSLNRFISFDTEQGILRCEAGTMFADILQFIVPTGWFLPVTPGTKYVTLGGAIANDVHGKNHHHDGTIGRHIRCFELLRSDGKSLICSPKENTDFFAATIGGLGLTGFISWAEIQLIKIPSPFMSVETTVFHGLEEFQTLSEQANTNHRYSVAWLDCASSGKDFARGLFMVGDHANSDKEEKERVLEPKISVPFNLPKQMINKYSVKAFNTLYFNKNRLNEGKIIYQHYDSFFYPLDGIGNWNRIYGSQGFYQYQFVVPSSQLSVMEQALNKIVASGLGSFLAVLKEFGDLPSPGMLSFPSPGLCLALDFANRGETTLALLQQLDQLVINAGGKVYPAKDVRMPQAAFQSYYPNYEEFEAYIDPRFISDFWRRVSEKKS